MPERWIRTLAFLALGLAALAAGCSAAGGDNPSGGSYPAEAPGCGAGDCSKCSNCMDACICVTNGDAQCIQACSGAGGSGAGGGPAAGGASGNGAVSAGGNAGAGAAAGFGGGAGVGTGGSSGVGGSTGGSGSQACGDGVCDFFGFEDCATCPNDCPCGSGGASGSGGVGGSGAGGSGAGGAGAGGAGGTSSNPNQAALDRAKAGVGFSYWWGHGRYRPEGPISSTAGSCSGGCPSCTHSGSYGGDCSGYVAKVWQVPSSNNDLTTDSHPYSTADFYSDTSQWSTIPQGDMKALDAMVYRSGGAGHIFIYDHGDAWGSMYAYECKGCSYGCTAGMRTASSSYHSIRRAGY